MITTVAANTCTCPESCSEKEELGRGTWKLLHSIVKHVDKTRDTKHMFEDLLIILSNLYPCEECRKHMMSILMNNLDEIEMTEKWMCEFHNMVNEKLDKPLFPCPSTS